MPTFGIPDMSTDVFRVLELFKPYDIDLPKRKVGPIRDGGYILADQLSSQDLISFGISNDVRFEKLLADAGHRCFLYDHTIAGLPDDHERFEWHKIGVSSSDDEADDLLSIKSHLDRIDHSERMILKIDVEGAEWDVFSTIDDETLGRFDQIAGEFHWLLELGDPTFRAKVARSMKTITRQFTLFHVHANNCRPLGFVGGFPVADVLELSFIRTDLVTPSPSTSVFPDAIDRANNIEVTDHPLLFFPFLPGSSEQAAIGGMIQRVQADRHHPAGA